MTECFPRKGVVNFRVVVTLLLFGFFLSQQSTYAQVLYGSLVGTVTDQSGAVVPGAAISVTEKQTGLSRNDTSDANGRYNFTQYFAGRVRRQGRVKRISHSSTNGH